MTALDPSHFPDLSSKEHKSREQAVFHLPAGPSSRVHIPAIPDLRFEQSYLKSIAPFVRTRPIASPESSERHGETAIDAGDEAVEVVSVDWNKVAWITTRDQVISPLLQGAIWGVAGQFIRPFFAYLGTFFRPSHYFRHAPRIKPPKKESEFGTRLREWGKSLTTSGLETNIALSK